MAEVKMSQAAPPQIVRLGLDQANAAAELLRQRGRGTMDVIAHFWERLSHTPPLARAGLHLVAALPGEANTPEARKTAAFSTAASGDARAAPPVGGPVVGRQISTSAGSLPGDARGAMLYVPRAHRADVLADSPAVAEAFAKYILMEGTANFDQLVIGPLSNNPLAENQPPAINFITGKSETVMQMLPVFLEALNRKAPERKVINAVMRLPKEKVVADVLSVREARDGDEAVLNRWRKQYKEERGILFDADVDAWIASRSVFVLEDGGQVVALAKFDLVLPTMVEIGGVYVFPEFRRKGFGSALVADIANRVHKMGKIATLQVDSENASALGVYQKAGWVEVGRLARVWLVSA